MAKQSNKEKKSIKPVVKNTKFTKNVIPIKGINGEYGFFEMDDGTFMDIISIVTKDLFNASESDINNDLYIFDRFYKAYQDDLKIISINFPTNTKLQQLYFKHKLNNTANPIFKNILREKYQELINYERFSAGRKHYLMYFGTSIPEMINHQNNILSYLNNNLSKTIAISQKIQVLFSMANFNTPVYDNNNKIEDYLRLNENANLVKKYGYNPYLINVIQPLGGIKLNYSDYIRTGEGYSTCMHIYEYPKEVGRHWMSLITNNDGALTTIDIKHVSKTKLKKDLQDAVSEYKGRAARARRSIDFYEADSARADMESLMYQVTSAGETIKQIDARVFLSSTSYENLMQQVEFYNKNVFLANGYKAAINLNEMYYEWTSMFKSFTKQNLDALSKRKGVPITANTLAGGDPFDFTELNDKYGSPFGYTVQSKGRVMLDLFDVSDVRTSYNAIVMGMMGSGKSTILKKIFRDRACRGDFIRNIDVTGEFSPLALSLGGKVVYLDGNHGALNPLQIKKAGDNDVDSFTIHISTVVTIYHFLAPESTHPERLILENLLRKLYEKYGMTPEQFSKTGLKITELAPTQYPILEELMPIIEQAEQEENNLQILSYIKNIKLVMQNLIQNYGNIFNKHTSISDLIDTQIVVYNIKNLCSNKEEIFNAQLFSALSLCWANAVKVGSAMKTMYENHQIDFIDIKRFLLIMDESHKTINSMNLFAVEQVLVYAREGRKYFAGILLASQSIRDFVPEGSSNEAFDKIRTLFELCQYKFIFKQDTNACDTLRRVFNDKFTDTEINIIPKLERGQTVLSINGDKNITFQVEVTDEELALFKGGV